MLVENWESSYVVAESLVTAPVVTWKVENAPENYFHLDMWTELSVSLLMNRIS